MPSLERHPDKDIRAGGTADAATNWGEEVAGGEGGEFIFSWRQIAKGVGERTKSTREKKGRNKNVSWGGETRAVSHEKKTRAVSHEKTSLEGILKRNHVAKPRGQKICKEQG